MSSQASRFELRCRLMHLAPGQSVGRYVIESLLGEGGMGTVYRARDTRLERKVALKVLRKEADEQAGEAWEQAVMRMQREAQAVAALSHPSIVAIYDIGDHEGAPFIAMELVEGKPLRDLIGTDLPLSVRWRILLDVARALAAAHDAGFLHRDIKPENIFVRPDNSAKVLDFGIARRTSPVETATVDVQGPTVDSAPVKVTADGVLVGTPAYMAPEHIRGETLDARADQFAWGVAAYEFLTGSHPFPTQKSMMALMAAVLGDTPKAPENVPDGMAYVVMRALAKDPAERWNSMQDILSAGEPWLTADELRPVASKRTNVPEERPTLDLPVPGLFPSPPALPTPAELPAPPVLSTPPVFPVKPAPSAPSRRAMRLGGIVALATLLVVAAGVGLSRRTSLESVPTSGVPSASVMPSAVATVITDLPIPHSNNAEARAAFREGMQSVRDARWAAASAAFLRARRADPEMAAAHLRYAMVHFSTDAAAAREAFRTALGLRRALSERETALFQAFEPIIQRDPSDYLTAAQRFEALVDRNPLDAELLYWYGYTLARSSLSRTVQERALDVADRCVKVDPQYADCWQIKTSTCLALDRTDEAIAAVNACIAQCDNSIDCLQDKIAIESSRGRCDLTVEAGRQLAVKDSMAPVPHRLHTEALYFSGASESTVRAAGQNAIRLFRDQKQDFEANQVATFLDIGFGDFQAAQERFETFTQPSIAPSAKRATDVLMGRIELLLEMNLEEKAVSVAQEALQRNSPAPSASTLFDPLPSLHAVLLRAGKTSRAQYEAARADWLAKRPPTTTLWEHQLRWLTGYGIPARSKDLAADALAASADLNLPLDLEKQPLAILLAMFLGKSYLLVGKPHEAIPYLERATRMCIETTLALWFVQNLARLGLAYEAIGDESRACQVYGKVLNRWGRSKQSVTAKNVAEHAKKLRCKTDTQ